MHIRENRDDLIKVKDTRYDYSVGSRCTHSVSVFSSLNPPHILEVHTCRDKSNGRIRIDCDGQKFVAITGFRRWRRPRRTGIRPSAFSLRNFGATQERRGERETRSRLIEGLARINEAPNISADRAEFTTSRRPAGHHRRDRQLDSNRRRLKLPRIRRDISSLGTDRKTISREPMKIRFRWCKDAHARN